MPYVSKEAIRKAREMDLLTYLQSYEPEELVRKSRNVYTTRTHDSLKISNGKWCWWSRNIGGRSALDYLIYVRGMKLPDAVRHLAGETSLKPPVIVKPEPKEQPTRLMLPPKNDNHEKVKAYLKGRGIHPDIIDYLIVTTRLYEDRRYHNAVFVGLDKNNQPRYALMRGTSENRFFMEAVGSDKRFSFSLPADPDTDQLHVFESAIDLLSYVTIELYQGKNPYNQHLLSLGGVYVQKNNCKIPLALERYLLDYLHIKTIYLHLDNDLAGRNCTEFLLKTLSDKYTVIDEPPSCGKDYNDYLRSLKLKLKKKEIPER